MIIINRCIKIYEKVFQNSKVQNKNYIQNKKKSKKIFVYISTKASKSQLKPNRINR
ncbi:hypothetical protein HanIR_Chr10g0472531 [Helianthus annuus]|nr:hypothetical protein HanIR_Chr10g0472531 [Helianthus annuus]